MEEVKIFWTGGWDSTFRLLSLVLVKKRKVQPYYIIDPGRASFFNEIRAMVRIKEMIFARCPEARTLIRPTIMALKDDIAPNEEITRMYDNILRWYVPVHQRRLAPQNEWLARFAEEHGLYGVEMCDHRVASSRGSFHEFMRDYIVPREEGAVLKEGVGGDRRMFKRFRYPLFYMYKIEEQEQARRYGFADIMEETWFCHTPRRGRPCGRCNPCTYAMRQGLARRVPPLRRIRYYAIKKPITDLRRNNRVRALIWKLLGRGKLPVASPGSG
jgi:hypothetical protein